ncbi:unnamed protein product [Calypogeia fissa]
MSSGYAGGQSRGGPVGSLATRVVSGGPQQWSNRWASSSRSRNGGPIGGRPQTSKARPPIQSGSQRRHGQEVDEGNWGSSYGGESTEVWQRWEHTGQSLSGAPRYGGATRWRTAEMQWGPELGRAAARAHVP